MDNLTDNIYKKILAKKSVLLVGPTDSGKTWYVENVLIPFFQERKIKVRYFADPDLVTETVDEEDVFIVDEIETLIDKDFLEARSVDPMPYYSQEYLVKVKIWHEKLKNLRAPSIFILTRNHQEEIDNIINNLKITDWGVKVNCLVFKKTIGDREVGPPFSVGVLTP